MASVGMKWSRLAEEALSLAEKLQVKDVLIPLSDGDIREIDLEAAVSLGIERSKAAKIACRIRSLAREEDRVKPLNFELWAAARKGFKVERGLFWTGKESLVGEVDRVLRQGADVNSTDKMGQTALHGACAEGHSDIVARLLRAGADINIADLSGAKANIKSHLPLLAVAGEGPSEVVEALLEAKTDVNQVHLTTGHTALHLAAKAGREDLLQLILNKKATVDVRDKRGRTALHFAASQGHVNCTSLLLDHGADPNSKTEAGTTALHWAAVMCSLETVKELLSRGADVNARNNDGFTAMDRAPGGAPGSKEEKLRTILREYGAVESLGWWSLRF